MCSNGAVFSQKQVYLVTEYLGKNYVNFFDLIQHSKGKGFGEDAGRFFLHQMLNVLEYLHSEAGIVHRDLKLENILIDEHMNFKLIDFGLSAAGDIYKAQGVVGSPSYIAPEVLKQHTYDGTKVDLFSVAVMLFVIV